MRVKLLTEHHLEFLSLTEGCTGLSESTLVKMPHCWKSHAEAQILMLFERVCIAGHGSRDIASPPPPYNPVNVFVTDNGRQQQTSFMGPPARGAQGVTSGKLKRLKL